MGTPWGITLQLAGACRQQLTIPSLDITVQELKRLISANAGEAGPLVCGLCFFLDRLTRLTNRQQALRLML